MVESAFIPMPRSSYADVLQPDKFRYVMLCGFWSYWHANHKRSYNRSYFAVNTDECKIVRKMFRKANPANTYHARESIQTTVLLKNANGSTV